MSARLAGLVLLVTVVALTAACHGANMPSTKPTAHLTPSTGSSGTTVTPRPEPSPIRPVGEDEEIWDLVIAATSGYISPILRPAALPEGFETVTTDDPRGDAPSAFVVEYAGPGKRLRIGAGMFNPPLPGPGGHQEAVKLRGLECNPEEKGKGCILQVKNDANPKERVWLWWNEPGRYVIGGGGPSLDSVFYLVAAEGLDPQEVMTVAESLQPTARLMDGEGVPD
jgi:hypothetical protein